jgi:pyridoxamine 5'-phosphate oxidase
MAHSPLIPTSPSEEAYRAEEDQGEVFTTDDPITLFEEWFALALKYEPSDANAMALATATAEGAPDVRMVLLKEIDQRGLTFYSNETSSKGRQLAANPRAALCFHWKSIGRQARFRGRIEKTSEAEADAYFASRARGAQLAAWASKQSAPLASREELEDSLAAAEKRFAGKSVPRPPEWDGYRLIPDEAEFWVNKPFRLHDRLLFSRDSTSTPWTTRRLYP